MDENLQVVTKHFHQKRPWTEKRVNKVEQNWVICVNLKFWAYILHRSIAPRLRRKKTRLHTNAHTWFKKSVLKKRSVNNSCSRVEEIQQQTAEKNYINLRKTFLTRRQKRRHGRNAEVISHETLRRTKKARVWETYLCMMK